MRSPFGVNLPSLEFMLADIPHPLDQVAKHIGVSAATLRRYKREGSAPRAVMLALYWETRWGRSMADSEASNWATMQTVLVKSLRRELERMAWAVSVLENEVYRAGQDGRAANLPVWRVG